MSENIVKTQALASDIEVKEVTGLEKVERVIDDDVLLLIRPLTDGSQKCYSVKGRLFHGEDAYQIAVKNGFTGTYEDWQDAVKKVVDVQPLADNLIKVTEDAQSATADAISATEAINLIIEQVNAAEAVRTSNENERQTNENSRKEAEDSREANEQARNTSENTRQENETARATAENKRVAAEEKREADFSASKDAADKATDKALSTYSHPPRVDDDGYYYVWNPNTQSYNKTDTNLTGKAFSIKKVFASVADMEATDVNTFNENDFILINTADIEDEDNAKLYVVAVDENGDKFYSYLVDLSGFRGFTGKTPQLVIGNIESLGEDEEAAASVTYSDVDSEGNPIYKVSFGIPKGRGFKFADFTKDQIEALKKPATDAANESKKQTALCVTATSNANDAASMSNSQTSLCKKATDAAQDVIDKFSDLIAAINIEVTDDGNAIADVSQDGSKLKFTKAGFLERFEMQGSSNKFDANNFKSGITFAYTETHSNVPTTGTLVSFAPKKMEEYAFQLQGRYTDDCFYFRRHDGDNNIWGDWRELIHSGNIGQQHVKDTDMVDGYHIDGYTKTLYAAEASVDSPAGSWVEIVFSAWNPLMQTVNIIVEGDNAHSYCVVHCGSTSPNIWGYQSAYNFDGVTRIAYGYKTDGKFRLMVLISPAATSLLIHATDSFVASKMSEAPSTSYAITASFFCIGGVLGGGSINGNVNMDGLLTIKVRKSDGLFLSGTNLDFIIREYETNKYAIGSRDNNQFLFEMDNGNFKAIGTISGSSSSDLRLKENIHSLDCLGIIKSMGGTVGFNWKSDGKESIGWIAQRVQQNPYMEDLVTCGEDGYLKINYWSPKLIAVAFGAIEQVGDEIDKLKARIKELESKIKELESGGEEA